MSTHDPILSRTRSATARRTPPGERALTPVRLALALVFVWFGLPKLVPGLSPAEDLVRATVPCCDPAWFVPALGGVEAFIGVCLLLPRLRGLGLFLLAGHMLGTALPLFTLPDVMWKDFPVATLEGQYVLKNVVLVAGTLALASAHRRTRAAHAMHRSSVEHVLEGQLPT